MPGFEAIDYGRNGPLNISHTEVDELLVDEIPVRECGLGVIHIDVGLCVTVTQKNK